jgi:hypothetical protein
MSEIVTATVTLENIGGLLLRRGQESFPLGSVKI